MEYGTLHYNISISQSRLDQIIDEALCNALAKDKMEVNGVEVVLEKAGAASALLEGKALKVEVPLNIDVKKSAGLFSIEGRGGIELSLKLNYDITRDLQLKCKTEIVDHKWTSKPKLELGALQIPVETLMNLVLDHYESVLTAKVDEAINKKSDLVPLIYRSVSSLEHQINEVLPFDNEVDIKLGDIQNLTPRTVDGMVSLSGLMELDMILQAKGQLKNDQLPATSWVAQLKDSQPLKPKITIGYDDISALLVEKLSGLEIGGKTVEIKNLDISGGEMFQVNAVLNQPIKGKVSVTGIQEYNSETGEISIEKLDVKVSPDNIIYKLTAPLVNKFIENKIEENFPFNLQSLIEKQIVKLPNTASIANGRIYPQVGKVSVSKIELLEKELLAILTIEKLALDLKID